MILPIYLYGQPVLRKATDEIEPGDFDLKQLVADMQETLTAAEGCGLAAPRLASRYVCLLWTGATLRRIFPECAGLKKNLCQSGDY